MTEGKYIFRVVAYTYRIVATEGFSDHLHTITPGDTLYGSDALYKEEDRYGSAEEAYDAAESALQGLYGGPALNAALRSSEIIVSRTVFGNRIIVSQTVLGDRSESEGDKDHG